MDVQSAAELGEPFDGASSGRHMFIALGTMASGPESIVGGVGFIVADPRKPGPVDTHYSKSLDWEQKGRTYSFNTIKSWMARSALARRSVTALTPPVALQEAMTAVAEAYRKYECRAIWGNAADLAILKHAMEGGGVTVPWDETQERNVLSVWATLEDLGMAPEASRGATEPDNVPLGDAAFMARIVASVYRRQTDRSTPDKTVPTDGNEELRV